MSADYDEFGIVLPDDIGARAALMGITGPRALQDHGDRWPDITGDWEYLQTPEQRAQEPAANTYQWVNLADGEYAVPPAPPTISGILYAGRRHVISGPPESTKTLVAYMLLLTALRQDEGVAILDFEMGPHAAATLLRELGATEDELAYIHYTEPYRPPHADDIQRIAGLGVGYCLIDAAAGAYDASGLDDNARKDAEQFASRWIRPLWQAGIATIVIDHVTKNVDTRGKFTIGSERKTGQADVHLSLEALKPLHRGSTGMVKIHVHKDRPGHLPRPTVFVVDLTSDENHRITWELREPIASTADGTDFRHTIYMERVSKHMSQSPDHLYSKNELEEAVEGKRDFIRAGLQELVEDGFVLPVDDGKWVKYRQVRPFAPGSPQLAPGEGDTHFAPSPHPLTGGGEARGEPNEGEPEPNLAPGEPIDVYDPDVQALLDQDPDF